MAFGLGKFAEVTHVSYYPTNYASDESNFSHLELLLLNEDTWSKVHELGHDNASCELMKSLAFDSTLVSVMVPDEPFVSRLIDYKP
jgi:hypothetical protein